MTNSRVQNIFLKEMTRFQPPIPVKPDSILETIGDLWHSDINNFRRFCKIVLKTVLQVDLTKDEKKNSATVQFRESLDVCNSAKVFLIKC